MKARTVGFTYYKGEVFATIELQSQQEFSYPINCAKDLQVTLASYRHNQIEEFPIYNLTLEFLNNKLVIPEWLELSDVVQTYNEIKKQHETELFIKSKVKKK